MLILAGSIASANQAGGDARLKRLFSMFMAPCCWQGNLLVHDSPKVKELRTEIRGMVTRGRTDEEIKATFVGKYSRRILALPEGTSGEWLWWTPVAILILGCAAVTITIKRLRRTSSLAPETELLPEAEQDRFGEFEGEED